MSYLPSLWPTSGGLSTIGHLRTPFDYGGVGNGVADDTVACQAWLNALCASNGAGFGLLPYGLWKITDTLLYTFTTHRYRNFGIIGMGGVLLSAIANTAKPVLSLVVQAGSGAQVRGLQIIGLDIEGQGGATPIDQDGISVTCDQSGQALYGFVINKCGIEGMGRHAIKITGNVFEGVISENRLRGCGTNGINFANGSTGIVSSIHVNGNDIAENRSSGVDAGSVINDVYYRDNDLVGNGSYGISQVNGIPEVSACHFENNHALAASSVDGQAAIACNNFITAIGCVAFASGAASKQVNLLRTSVVNNALLEGCWSAASGGAPAINMVWLNGGGTAGRKVELRNCIGIPTASTPVVNFVIDGQARPITITAGRTVAPQEPGAIFINTGAAGAVAMTLPTTVNTIAGMTYTCIVNAAQTFGFTPNTGVQIRDGTTNGTATTGTLTSNELGAVVTVKALSTTQWIVMEKRGTWTLA